jgi:subtilisin family serine protease
MQVNFQRTNVNPHMDPRLQRLVDTHGRRGLFAMPDTTEAGVIALVSDLAAWREHEDVHDPVAIARTDRGWIVTATVPIAQIETIRHAGFVLSLKASQPLRPTLTDTVPEINATAATLSAGLFSSGGEGAIVGVVDGGLSVVHRNFRNADGSTRLVALWDQSAENGPDSPFGYGRRYGAGEIDAALRAGEPHLALLGFGAKSSEAGGHGTHVTDIAAGNGLGTLNPGVAPKSGIIFVQYAPTDLAGSGTAVVGSELGDSKRLLDALRFIFDEAGDTPCVVNISLGTNGGPHDGTSLVEAGIDALVAEQPGRAVVISGGNAFTQGIHAAGTVPQHGTADVSWTILETVASHSEIELWYPGSDRLGIHLLAPDGSTFGPIPLGSNGRVHDDDGDTVLFVSHRAGDPNNGDNVVNLFVDKRLPTGVWTVRLRGEQVETGGFHAWIERDDRSQSSFLTPHDSSHTVGSLSCGKLSIVVGSYDAHQPAKPLSVFTAAGPTRDDRPKPDLSAPGQEVKAAHSRTTTGTTVKSGTSMAAPAVAGVVALLFAEAAARGLTLDARTVRRLLIESARSDPPRPFTVATDGRPEPQGTWDPRYGFGRVDAAGVLAALDKLVPADD